MEWPNEHISVRTRECKMIDYDNMYELERAVTYLKLVCSNQKIGVEIVFVSKSDDEIRKETIRTLKKLIRDVYGVERRCSIGQLVNVAVASGIDRDEVLMGVDTLMRRGEAMEPKQGIIQLI